jgi:hypothetical protein
MLRLGLLTVIGIALFTAAVSIIVVPPHNANAAHWQTLSDAFALNDCGPLCWHNVQLGKTTIAEAERILSADPDIVMRGKDGAGCQVTWDMAVNGTMWRGRICGNRNAQPGQPVTWLDLTALDKTNTQFTLLDAILLYGRPTAVQCGETYLHRSPATYSASVAFKNGTQIGWTRDLPYSGLLFDPLMPVTWIRHDVNGGPRFFFPGAWTGFMSERFADAVSSGRCMVAIE